MCIRLSLLLLSCALLAACGRDETPIQPVENQWPGSPENPWPAHSSTVESKDTVRLSWSCSDPDGDSLVYDVFFGTTSMVQIADDIPWTSMVVTVEPGKQYQWNVVAHDARGGRSGGSQWTFTTGVKWLESSLVAWFPFSNSIADESRSNLPSSSVAVTFSNGRERRDDRAGWFNGLSSEVRVPDAPVLHFDDRSFTASAWVLPSGAPQDFAGIVAKQLDDPTKTFFPGFQLSFRSGGLIEAAVASSTGRTEATSTTSIVDGSWHNVAMTVDRETQTLSLYIDGELVDARALVQGSSTTTAPLYIGHERRREVYFAGAIDDVALFDRALSADEIRQLQTFGH
jgi:hypothetical protein